MAGCDGPLGVGCGGSGGWCGCDCSCCPPSPCYSSVTVDFECGSPNDYYDPYYPFIDGCTCLTPVAAPFMAMSKPTTPLFDDEEDYAPVPFPDFIEEDIKAQAEDGMVYALAACSVVCATYSVTLSTTGCCFTVSGNSITHIGSGTVSGSVPSGDCSPMTVSINGGGSSAVVGDCGGVSVGLTPGNGCCQCCAGTVSGFAMMGLSQLNAKRTIQVRAEKTQNPNRGISKAELVKRAVKRALKLKKFKKKFKKKSD